MGNSLGAFGGYSCFFGDLHNHCNASYGHGSLEDAFANARLQLDFASVTGHSSWPDMPKREGIMTSVVDYHVAGFDKLETQWDHFLRTTEANNAPGEFVSLLSYEIHSMRDGDYTALLFDADRPMHKPPSIHEMQDWVRAENAAGRRCIIFPHHIAYKTGYRGINWDSFSETASPLVEIVSMHGCSESDDAAFQYLHTMGPRNGRNTMQAALERGFHFGVTGSTDHHSAHPGSYGYGKTGLWAGSLTREGIWEALQNRRTYAVSGDSIVLEFAVNGAPMGSRLESTAARRVEFAVRGGYALDYIEVLKNNAVVHRHDVPRQGSTPGGSMRGKVIIELGWGEKSVEQDWEVSVDVADGRLLGIEPRFHGVDTVDPKDRGSKDYHFSSLSRRAGGLDLRTKTWGNPTANTHAAQGVCLEVEGEPSTVISAVVNGKRMSWSLARLRAGSETEYLGGFLTGAVCVHRFIPEAEYSCRGQFVDDDAGNAAADHYYLRAAQKNGHWAWSSPIRMV